MTAISTTTTVTTGADAARDQVRLADLLERLLWTFVAAFTSALVSPPLAEVAGVEISLSALEAAFLAGTSAVVGFFTVVARWRLSILPDPGSGLHRG